MYINTTGQSTDRLRFLLPPCRTNPMQYKAMMVGWNSLPQFLILGIKTKTGLITTYNDIA